MYIFMIYLIYKRTKKPNDQQINVRIDMEINLSLYRIV